MAKQLSKLVFCALMGVALSANEAAVSAGEYADTSSLHTMEKVFARSERAHLQSMAEISRTLSVSRAVAVLRKSNLNATAVSMIASAALAGSQNLRKGAPKKGYGGIEGARNLLNDMIFESLSKYDQEIAKCTEYYSKQCAAMEACRGQISASNYIAANSRMLILDSQATINKCEVDIPERKLELKQHNLKCKHELHKMNTRLKIVMGDIAIMTMILKMTDCEKKGFVQMGMKRCEDPCTKKTFMSFDHNGLQKKVSQLQSVVSHDLMSDTFKDLFDGIESMESLESHTALLHIDQAPMVNKTKFNNPPVPRTKVPMNPCTDPNAGAPSAEDKRAAKCSIKKSPQCYKLQERFLLIQAGIQDERDELMAQIEMMEEFCEKTKEGLEKQISDDEDTLANAQTKLAAATEKEATAGETARMTAAENEQLNGDLVKQMKTCSQNYIAFETELCALKKIRGELYKMKGSGHSAFFQDCEVSKWDPEECTKKCKGGEQKLTRSVLVHPNGGAKCLPLAAMRSCNNQPCPVDCQLSTWSGWSKCSAECGGGVQQRLREVKLAMRHGGEPCGDVSQTKACNGQACEKDCELSPWTGWSFCSKDCDGGTQKRQKFIKKEAEGEGKCPGAWSMKRLQYKPCNMKRCVVPNQDKPLSCNKTLDVILLMDGSGSVGKKGWASQVEAARSFLGAMKGGMEAGNVIMSVILYSGPRTWSGISKCTGKSEKPVKPEACGIKTVSHFTEDFKKLDQKLVGLDFPKGSTLTSLALMTAKAEFSLGRKTATGVVVVFTDGRPLSFRKTEVAARGLRKVARLVWVPVTKYAPLKQIKEWATRRWQENVVKVSGFAQLKKPTTITHIVADICPKKNPKLRFERGASGDMMALDF